MVSLFYGLKRFFFGKLMVLKFSNKSSTWKPLMNKKKKLGSYVESLMDSTAGQTKQCIRIVYGAFFFSVGNRNTAS